MYVYSSTYYVYQIAEAEIDNCDEYYVLNDHTRNTNYGVTDFYCDDDAPSSGTTNISPDWKGTGWYRIWTGTQLTGTMIPEMPVASYYCNTVSPGWLDRKHPTVPGKRGQRNII